jgi:elongation factor P--(R)-beta-lysine ligase
MTDRKIIPASAHPTSGVPAFSYNRTAELHFRAQKINKIRAFFSARHVLEVDTPVLQSGANLDHSVVPFRLSFGQRTYFLPTSPEHALKRMLINGVGDCWTLAPAFRAGEIGARHAEEFRMLEWYRLGFDDRQLAEETIALCATVTDLPTTSERLTWAAAFEKYCGINPFTAMLPELHRVLAHDAAVVGDDRAAALDLLLTRDIEPHLGNNCWTILTDYPAEACAQARIRRDEHGRSVAARFEIYRSGIELANGYHELTDGKELRTRHMAELPMRTHGEQLDELFLSAMEQGLPDCAGVAVGFDRLLMIAQNMPRLAPLI